MRGAVLALRLKRRHDMGVIVQDSGSLILIFAGATGDAQAVQLLAWRVTFAPFARFD
jgi:hypothetical protein